MDGHQTISGPVKSARHGVSVTGGPPYCRLKDARGQP